VDDGSTDNTAAVVRRYPSVHLFTQANAGPAGARNRGVAEARGNLILFTDDDCVPAPEWAEAMLEPFSDPQIVGTKGTYRTRQRSLAARFVQIEYEDRYRRMARFPYIDFVDTYSAAFRRDRFLEMDGYDTTFPVACAEDAELSYRISERGWKMKFVPDAVVYHTHPNSFAQYLKKKYKFAFWRVLALRKNPGKAVRDSHTPQIMKLQLLLAPMLAIAASIDLTAKPTVSAVAAIALLFLFTTIPFTLRAISKDWRVGLLSPLVLAGRSCAQAAGVASGLIYARRNPATLPHKSQA
jgi:cellulose synthase/poly-beta-1,6-N-acetylglucosamine synthase-like glycosyltransferase